MPVRAVYGIRFAETWSRARFAQAYPVEDKSRFQRLRDVPIFPQAQSRMAYAMGDAPGRNPQDEQAFFLNVWAPDHAHGLPVLVFIHGGAWTSGGGAVEWYDGEALAAKGVVVVTLNYRLGPLGHFAPPNASPVCRPLDDLLLALRWVQENIGSFGGDPDAVTLMGQSAGAWYVHALSLTPEAQGLLSRLALLSGAWGPEVVPWSVDRWREVNRGVQTRLGVAHAPSSAPLGALLDAGAAASASPPQFGEIPTAYLPVQEERIPADVLQRDPVTSGRAPEAVYIRYTQDENSMFFALRDLERKATRQQVNDWLASLPIDELPPDVRGDGDPYLAIVRAGTWRSFGAGATSLADRYAAGGVHVLFRRFETTSSYGDLGATHCLDLPFQFGTRRAWDDAPMLRGLSAEVFDAVSTELMDDVVNFVAGAMNKQDRHAPGAPPRALGRPAGS